jgi:hypothetical protein
MSKGGAGKVYFVLYLAVILELLIIIVERDEAEEHLMKKQQESMRIVESILTQLQSGAGTEGINTRPQDAIVISDNLPDEQKKLFKKFRTYYIEVGVTDVSSALNMDGMDEAQKKEKAETLKKLANVQELQYEIYYNPSKELNAPDSPPLSEFKKVEQSPQEGMSLANSPNSTATDSWQLLATRKIDLDIKGMKDYQEPIYTDSPKKAGDINKYAPQDSASVNRVFGYSEEKTNKLKQNTKLTKRAFVCNFQPDGREGWYKLRFSSQTNRILGISADQKFNALKDDQKVNIGTVQLKVKDLKSVQRQLSDQLSGTGIPSSEAFANGSLDLEKFNDQLEVAKKKVSDNGGDKVAQNTSRIDLYGYIAKLLSPGRYTSFDQNRGSIEIDIFVQKPEIEQLFPDVRWVHPVYNSFDKAPKAVAILSTNLYDKANLKPTVFIDGRQISPNNIIKLQDASKFKDGEWRVEINEPLEEKIYKLTAKFSSSSSKGMTDSATVDLRVFKTSLFVGKEAEDSEKSGSQDLEQGESADEVNYNDDLKRYLENDLSKFETFGYNTKPSSMNKIAGTEFETHLKINDKVNIKKGTFNISKNEGIELNDDVLSVGLKIFWVNPHDQQIRVRLFPLGDNEDIAYKLKNPKARFESSSVNFESSGNPNDPFFTFSVRVLPYPSSQDKASAKATIVSATATVKSDAIIGGSGKGKYQLKASGSGKLEPDGNGFKLKQKFTFVGRKPVPKGTSFKISVDVQAVQKLLQSGEICEPGNKKFISNIKF